MSFFFFEFLLSFDLFSGVTTKQNLWERNEMLSVINQRQKTKTYPKTLLTFGSHETLLLLCGLHLRFQSFADFELFTLFLLKFCLCIVSLDMIIHRTMIHLISHYYDDNQTSMMNERRVQRSNQVQTKHDGLYVKKQR